MRQQAKQCFPWQCSLDSFVYVYMYHIKVIIKYALNITTLSQTPPTPFQSRLQVTTWLNMLAVCFKSITMIASKQC